MNAKRQGPLDPATQLRNLRLRFRAYIIATGLLILFFAFLSAKALVNNYYRSAPSTQEVTATVTYTQPDCTKSGCYFDSFGDYSIYDTPVQNVKVAWLTKHPVTGQVPVLVNPHRPQLAMPYYGNPYPAQAIAAGVFASFFILWDTILYIVFYRRHEQKLAALID